VYSYLGSVDTILNDEVGAKANFEKAVALDPADAFSAGELNRWQVASSLKPQSVPGQGSLEAVRDQDALAAMHVREAIHKAGMLTPTLVAGPVNWRLGSRRTDLAQRENLCWRRSRA
jgi:hypothetical protein